MIDVRETERINNVVSAENNVYRLAGVSREWISLIIVSDRVGWKMLTSLATSCPGHPLTSVYTLNPPQALTPSQDTTPPHSEPPDQAGRIVF